MESAFQKFTRIIRKWIGKAVDYDKAYGAQCVDFARQYAADAGYPIGTFSGSAYNGWRTGSPFNKKWARIEWAKGRYPNPGDIVFFAPTRLNPYGHVAIGDAGSDSINLCIVEQNAGSGNGDGKGSNAIKKTRTVYNGTRGQCVGWFALKVK